LDLLAYTPPLKLQQCCAKPANAVRKATIEDIKAWIDERHLCPSCWNPLDTCSCEDE
jgi:hypothetical protein